jgi:hypothetical protein
MASTFQSARLDSRHPVQRLYPWRICCGFCGKTEVVYTDTEARFLEADLPGAWHEALREDVGIIACPDCPPT